MNPRQKKELGVLVALVCVLLVGWWAVLRGPFSAPAGGEGVQEASADVPGPDSAGQSRPSADETEEDETATLDLRQVQLLIDQASDYLAGKRTALQEAARDPFRLDAEGAEAEESVEGPFQVKRKPDPDLSFQLTAIIWDEKHPMAVINGRVVREGDEVGRAIRLTRIEPKKVTLTFHYWGRENTLTLSLEPR